MAQVSKHQHITFCCRHLHLTSQLMSSVHQTQFVLKRRL